MKNHLSPPYNSTEILPMLEDVEMLCFIINSKNDSIYWKNTKKYGVACNMVIKSQALNYIQFAMMTMMVKLLEIIEPQL